MKSLMKSMTELEQFDAALGADPADAGLRLVFADWLEEHGFPLLAAVQRRRVAEKCYPFLMESAIRNPLYTWNSGTNYSCLLHKDRVEAEYGRCYVYFAPDVTENWHEEFESKMDEFYRLYPSRRLQDAKGNARVGYGATMSVGGGG